MTSFEINSASADLLLRQYVGRSVEAMQVRPYRLNPAGMRDPIGLAKAHLRFLAGQLAEKGAGFAESIGFTSIDQAFILWGAVSIVIFAIAQFSTVSWTTQAILDAAITGACIVCTSGLTWQVATIANLRWVVFLWAMLMTAGMVLTTYGIFCGVGSILINLCPLWLGLCALGYGVMGFKMRSYSFTSAALVHGIGIVSLAYFPAWQFFVSGLVMALTLFFFSVVPWDMHTEEVDEPG